MKTIFWFALCISGWGVGAFLMAHLGRTLAMGTVLACNLIGYTIAIAILARNVSLGWSWNHLCRNTQISLCQRHEAAGQVFLW